MAKVFKHRKRTQILGYRSPDWWKGKSRLLTFRGIHNHNHNKVKSKEFKVNLW